jgi:putative two-component system response regulator
MTASKHDPPPAPGGHPLSSRLRHDLLTPVSQIIGFSEMLLEEASGGVTVYLHKIHGAGKQLLSLVRALFDPGKTAGDPSWGAAEIGNEMRFSVDQIVGYCEMLLEESEESGQCALAPDLRNIQTAAINLIGLMEAGLGLARASGAASPSPAGGDPAAGNGPPRGSWPRGEQTPFGPILVVDDNEKNREMLFRRLERLGYTVFVAEHGRAALDMMAMAKFDLVLLDVMMPELNGYEVLQRMKSDASLKDIPVIVISALDEIGSIVRCIEMGAEDYLPKPFDPVLLKARVGASLEKKRLRDQEVVHLRQMEKYSLHLQELVEKQIREVSRAQMGTIFALSNLAESRDPETGEHLARVREYCRVLAQELGTTSKKCARVITPAYVENLFTASPLHDIGKVGIPDHVLRKPGRLTEDEFEVMKTHTTLGAATLRAVDAEYPGNGFIQMGIEIVESHHEKWDGSGYPHGLAGESIPLSARIMALADVYDALRSKRCYKERFSHEKSRGIILEQRGRHFDPDLVDCFLRREAEFEAIWARLHHDE